MLEIIDITLLKLPESAETRIIRILLIFFPETCTTEVPLPLKITIRETELKLFPNVKLVVAARMKLASLALWGVATLVATVSAHVRLNFPLGRDLPLDFLDNFRTTAPCGMPKGESKTTFRTGARLNVTWHLAYPHQGTFKSRNLRQTITLFKWPFFLIF